MAGGGDTPDGGRDGYYLTTAIFYPAERLALHSMFEAIGRSYGQACAAGNAETASST